MYAAVRRYQGITDDTEAGRLVRDSLLDRRRRHDCVAESLRGKGGRRPIGRACPRVDRRNRARPLPNPPQVIEGEVAASELASVGA